MRGCFHRSLQRWASRRGRASDRETRQPTSSYHPQKQPVTSSDNSHKYTRTRSTQVQMQTSATKVIKSSMLYFFWMDDEEVTSHCHDYLFVVLLKQPLGRLKSCCGNIQNSHISTNGQNYHKSTQVQVHIKKETRRTEKNTEKSHLCPSSESTASSYSYQVSIVSEYVWKHLRNVKTFYN